MGRGGSQSAGEAWAAWRLTEEGPLVVHADALDAVRHVEVAEGGHVLEEHLQVEVREELLHVQREDVVLPGTAGCPVRGRLYCVCIVGAPRQGPPPPTGLSRPGGQKVPRDRRAAPSTEPRGSAEAPGRRCGSRAAAAVSTRLHMPWRWRAFS